MIRTSREVLLAKVESTYNVDPTPTAVADAILVGNASWGHEGLRMNERNTIHGTLAKRQSLYGGTLKTISFDVELKGSGAAGTAPEFGVLFKGCGFTETVVASTSVTYDPSSDEADHESLTFYYYQDGLLHVITGARGTFSVNLETGAIPVVSFVFTGHTTTPSDVALPTPTLDATEPFAIKGASFSIDSYAACINSLAFDMGISVITPSCMNDSDGFGEVTIGSRDCNGSIDPEAELTATEDFYGNFVSGKKMALTTGVIGSTAGNRFQIDMDQVYYRDASPGDRDGIRTFELPFGAVETSGDDEVSIIFT